MNSSPALQDLAALEGEAKKKAQQKVANLLQRPDQLEKVDQLRKNATKKKASVEAMLKTAVQSQLDGVRTGMSQLHNALCDIKEIKQGLAEVDETYRSVASLSDKLTKVREENSRHSQLAAAVENLKHIFTVPEHVKKTEDLIGDGKLLHAHKCVTDLEASRDDLLSELHKQQVQSPTDRNIVNHYFADVEKLSESLSKQLWLILQRTIMTVRREPTIIVTVLRIIEREERMDAIWNKKYDQSGFLPPGRPKRWRQRCFQVLEEAVQTRVEGNQMEDRSTNKMWLVRHLEVTRQLILEDLRVVKTLCEPCFPPYYGILSKYVAMYHNGTSQHLNEMIQQGLEGNEIVSLLTWVHSYNTEELMMNSDLKIDTTELGPLLESRTIAELQNTYLQTLRGNFEEWMANSLRSDIRDWQRDLQPDADDKGYFNTAVPVILFQMIEQNLQVASTIGENLVMSVLNVCIDELISFSKTYKAELKNYKDRHLQDRSQPPFFLHYMIANINNCESFADLSILMRKKYTKQAMNEMAESSRFKDVSNNFNTLASELCDFMLEEVFMDLDAHILDLLSRKWLRNHIPLDTICITAEDYCRDFVHLRSQYHDMVLAKLHTRVTREYFKALFGRKISFKNYEERIAAAEQVCREGDQLSGLFERLAPRPANDSPLHIIPMLAEVIKMRDTSMMSLELSGLANRCPDLRSDQLTNLLLMRGDVSRSDARQMVLESLGEEDKRHKTIGFFSDIPAA